MCLQLFAHITVQCGLPNGTHSHKLRFYSPNCSNYVTKIAAACLQFTLHFTSQTEQCTVDVMILHVHLLSYNDIYIYIYICTLPVHPQNARGGPAFAVSFIVKAKRNRCRSKAQLLQTDTVSGIG